MNTFSLQPVFIHNLTDGWYLRSSGTWSYDVKSDHYFVPIGLGAGKVF